MCVDTLCNHDRDPVVQFIERDYGFMELEKRQEWNDGDYLCTTVAVDSRVPGRLMMEASAPGTVTEQPMFTLKKDNDHWGDAAHWSAWQGPVLPWEEFYPPRAADKGREDAYLQELAFWYKRKELEVPDRLTLAIYRQRAARAAELDAEHAERQARMEQRRTQAAAYAVGGERGPQPTIAVYDEAFTFDTTRMNDALRLIRERVAGHGD